MALLVRDARASHPRGRRADHLQCTIMSCSWSGIPSSSHGSIRTQLPASWQGRRRQSSTARIGSVVLKRPPGRRPWGFSRASVSKPAGIHPFDAVDQLFMQTALGFHHCIVLYNMYRKESTFVRVGATLHAGSACRGTRQLFLRAQTLITIAIIKCWSDLNPDSRCSAQHSCTTSASMLHTVPASRVGRATQVFSRSILPAAGSPSRRQLQCRDPLLPLPTAHVLGLKKVCCRCICSQPQMRYRAQGRFSMPIAWLQCPPPSQPQPFRKRLHPRALGLQALQPLPVRSCRRC